jgi:hypothetical protein
LEANIETDIDYEVLKIFTGSVSKSVSIFVIGASTERGDGTGDGIPKLILKYPFWVSIPLFMQMV